MLADDSFSNKTTGGRCLTEAVLLAVAAALFFSGLACPLLEPEETRYAEIPRQMLAEGRWLVPVLHGQPYYDKPPLLYWLVMAGYAVFGVHDWAARLVSSGAAFLCVPVTYYWGKRTAGVRAGLAAALMLCLSARFLHLGRLLTMNSLLCLTVISALGSAHIAAQSCHFRRRWWLISAIACGLGLLTKGPVALVLVAVPVAALAWLKGRGGWQVCRSLLLYGLVALVVALPWYLSVAIRDPGFVGYFFWTHHAVRFMAPIDHAEPVWYYLPGLLLGMLPWTLLLPGMVRRLVRQVRERRPAGPSGFFILAAGWCFCFFSAAGCKRSGYILPAMPPLALALGCYLDMILPPELMRRSAARLLNYPAALPYWLTVFILLMTAGLGLVAVTAGLLPSAPGAVAIVVIGIGLVGIMLLVRSRRLSWAGCFAAAFVATLFAAVELLPAYAERFSLREAVKPFSASIRDDRIPIMCYPHRWDSVNFYLQNDSVQVYGAEERARMIAEFLEHPRTLLFVKTERYLPQLLRELPASLEFVPCGRQYAVTAGWVRHR